MTSLSLTPPALTVRQLYSRSPVSAGRRLLPFLIGPLAHTVRYAEADEHDNGFLGEYDDDPAVVSGTAQSLYDWPTVPVGNVVDLSSARLFVESGLARYFLDQSHTATKTASNRVRLASKVFKTAAGSNSDVLDAGVAIGDLVRISGVLTNTDPFTLGTYVVDLIGDAVAATVGPVTAVSTNKAAASAAAVVTAGGDNSGDQSAACSAAAYNGQSLGLATETYTLTITTGGAANTARMSVVSASGLDNASSVLITALGSAVSFGAKGMTVTFTNVSSATFTAGDTWTVAVTTKVNTPSLAVTGTYTGSRDRSYIIEVVRGDRELSSAACQVQVSSQDGTDSGAATVVPASGPISLGSYGLSVEFTAAQGLMKGDKWIVDVTAATTGVVHTIELANGLPTAMANDNTADLEIELFKKVSAEIPHESETAAVFNYVAEASQLLVRGDVAISLSSVTLDGDVIAMPLVTAGEFTGMNQLYVEYRAWYPTGTDLFAIEAQSQLDDVLDGPIDPDNPLKYAVDCCRLGAVGETIYAFIVGDPSDIDNWQVALDAAARNDSIYGYVPLTTDPDIQVAVSAAIATANGEQENAYRVGWLASPRHTGGAVVDVTTTDDDAICLAVVEDNSAATGTQYTQLRVTSDNVDLIALGVRAGDTVRYLYSVDSWGNETYVTRTVASIRSAEILILSEALSAAEVVPRRVEIHRVYNVTELRERYGADAAVWNTDLIRHVIAPEAIIGSRTVPGYYVAAILAGMRAAIVPQQILSTVQIPGVANVLGLEQFTNSDLNLMAGSGALICVYDYRSLSVKIRHAITTVGAAGVLVQREESIVSARHAALFEINDRLSVYVGQANLGDDDAFGVLAEQIRGELKSVEKSLIARGFSNEFGGLIRELTISSIAPNPLAEDELIIIGELTLGKPANKITFQVSIA